MKLMGWAGTVAVAWVAFFGVGLAQEKGVWRAESTTARSITGDISFSGQRLFLNFTGYTVTQIRELKPAEVQAVFDGADAEGTGNLFRTDIPSTKSFLHKNKLCGAEDTEWVVTYVAGKRMQLAFFSGSAMPVLTAEAMASGAGLCGTYSFVR